MPAPLQLIMVSLPPGAQPDRVLAEIDRVQARGNVRVLDSALVAKGDDGEVVVLSRDESEPLGGLISSLVTLDGVADAGSGAATGLWSQLSTLPAGSSALCVLVEHSWAQGIVTAIGEQGGVVLDADFLPFEPAAVINAAFAAVEDAVEVVDAAHVVEAEARLTALEAWAEADDAVTESARIRAAAAAQTVRALTTAGLVEAAAIHEALDALSAADLIVAGAEDTAARAWAADADIVAAVGTATDEAIAEDLIGLAAANQKLTDARVAASITPAELRVLRYLPTKLTYALIASKLGISRGAAKMRAERAYQRLGVHTRADAVDRMRAMRVLP